MSNQYVTIKNSNLRRPAGVGRQHMKLSFTPDVWETMGELGVGELYDDGDGPRLKRGKFTSAYIQLAIDLLSGLLFSGDYEDNEQLRRATRILHQILPTNSEDASGIITLLRNMQYMDSDLSRRRKLP